MVKIESVFIDSDNTASVSDYSLSYICDTKDLTDHFHYCYKLAIGLSQAFDCLIDGSVITAVRGIIINENVPHSFLTPGVDILLNYSKIDSLHGNQLTILLDGRKWLDLDSIIENFNPQDIFPQGYENLSNQSLIPVLNRFLDLACFVTTDIKLSGDERINLALRVIENNLLDELMLDKIADQIHLSVERAWHLFADEVGMPVTQYVLWKRIRNTIKIASQPGNKIVDACYMSGFSDQTHFSKAFRRIFVLKPTPVIRHCRIII